MRRLGLASVLALAALLSLEAQPAQVLGESEAGSSKGSILLDSLLRFESIAIGSFPLSLFYTGFGFDMAAYISHGFDSLYAPWPFKSDRAPSLGDDEKLLRLSSALVLSLCIASLDALIKPGAVEKRRRESGVGGFPLPSSPSLPGPGTPSDAKDPATLDPLEVAPGNVEQPPLPQTGELDSVPGKQ